MLLISQVKSLINTGDIVNSALFSHCCTNAYKTKQINFSNESNCVNVYLSIHTSKAKNDYIICKATTGRILTPRASNCMVISAKY